MAFLDLSPSTSPRVSLFDGIFSKATASVQAVQYSKMIQALSTLSDENLKQIGIARADIPEHARRCIYG